MNVAYLFQIIQKQTNASEMHGLVFHCNGKQKFLTWCTWSTV